MRELLMRSDAGDLRAQIAVQVFCYRLAKSIAGLVVGLGRLDALVFTGGIGENSIPVREKVLDLLPFLGLTCDAVLNASHGAKANGIITCPGNSCALVVNTDEEMVIARDTLNLLPA
jgi:acetate kinase